jgi:restriction system protein
MARRGKSSPAEVFVEIASKLPWWVSLVLAGVGYLALHAFAIAPSTPITPGHAVDGVIPAMLKGLSFAGQYILPMLFGFAAVLSFFNRAKPDAKQPPISANTPFNTKSTSSIPACPVCSNPMVMRSAKKGGKTGNTFWGCSNYPRCKGTRAAD